MKIKSITIFLSCITLTLCGCSGNKETDNKPKTSIQIEQHSGDNFIKIESDSTTETNRVENSSTDSEKTFAEELAEKQEVIWKEQEETLEHEDNNEEHENIEEEIHFNLTSIDSYEKYTGSDAEYGYENAITNFDASVVRNVDALGIHKDKVYRCIEEQCLANGINTKDLKFDGGVASTDDFEYRIYPFNAGENIISIAINGDGDLRYQTNIH